ncbi:hypothetical protein E2986_11203 [Frieseomelitta varia]|uniref:Uncharacterized protein n=1 Tax=Frieseomelitta varia TaxID=561572 RepID=A0A833RPB5_9HYME|nr:hypothetical protein E2986_11203 [Frieseomelitta varia]
MVHAGLRIRFVNKYRQNIDLIRVLSVWELVTHRENFKLVDHNNRMSWVEGAKVCTYTVNVTSIFESLKTSLRSSSLSKTRTDG